MILEVAEALALTLPLILRSSVLIVKGEEEFAVEFPSNKLKSEAPLIPALELIDPRKSRSRSTRRRVAEPA